MDHNCKDTDLYPYDKQHKSKRDGRGAFHAIHFRWLGLNHVDATASEAELALQMPTCDGERRHRAEKSALPDISSTISSCGTLWNMDTKALIQDQKLDTY